MTDQKTLLLTGASRGIGHATVKRFEREGWRVLTCSRHPFDPRCPWPNGEANHVQIDLASPDKTIAALEARDHRGRLALEAGKRQRLACGVLNRDRGQGCAALAARPCGTLEGWPDGHPVRCILSGECHG